MNSKNICYQMPNFIITAADIKTLSDRAFTKMRQYSTSTGRSFAPIPSTTTLVNRLTSARKGLLRYKFTGFHLSGTVWDDARTHEEVQKLTGPHISKQTSHNRYYGHSQPELAK